MNKHSKLSLIFADKTVINYAYKVAKGNDLYKDILSEILVYLYDLPDDKFEKIADLKSYVCKMIYFSWNSSTSPFYKKFRNDNDFKVKENSAVYSDDGIMKELEQIEIEMSKKRYPTAVRMFELYVDLGSYKAVGDILDLPAKSVYNQVQQVIEKIKKKI